jgi:hypothetical protein
LAVTDPVVAVKPAVVAPAPTVTAAGTLRTALLEERVTAAPPAGAALLSVTVQEDVPPEITEAGPQARAVVVTVGVVTVIVPPVPVTEAVVPSDRLPITLLSGIENELVPDESARFRTATVPVPIEAAFIPDARQVTVPAPGLQLSVLPADVRADPAAAFIDVTLTVGYVNVHASAAGAVLPAASVSEREIEPPGRAVAELRLRELWACRDSAARRTAKRKAIRPAGFCE